MSVFPSATAGDMELVYSDVSFKKKDEKNKTGKKLDEARRSTLLGKTTQESISLWFITQSLN